jgi:hypothetical protein
MPAAVKLARAARTIASKFRAASARCGRRASSSLLSGAVSIEVIAFLR